MNRIPYVFFRLENGESAFKVSYTRPITSNIARGWACKSRELFSNVLTAIFILLFTFDFTLNVVTRKPHADHYSRWPVSFE